MTLIITFTSCSKWNPANRRTLGRVNWRTPVSVLLISPSPKLSLPSRTNLQRVSRCCAFSTSEEKGIQTQTMWLTIWRVVVSVLASVFMIWLKMFALKTSVVITVNKCPRKAHWRQQSIRCNCSLKEGFQIIIEDRNQSHTLWHNLHPGYFGRNGSHRESDWPDATELGFLRVHWIIGPRFWLPMS